MGASILRRSEVLHKIGISKTTLQTLMDAGQFPKPVKLGGPDARAVGWVDSEVQDWIDQKIAERDSMPKGDV